MTNNEAEHGAIGVRLEGSGSGLTGIRTNAARGERTALGDDSWTRPYLHFWTYGGKNRSMKARAGADLHSYSKMLEDWGGCLLIGSSNNSLSSKQRKKIAALFLPRNEQCTFSVTDLPPSADILESESSHTGP